MEYYTTYFYGDRARYTGNSQRKHGGLFYEILILEGHLKGELRWTSRAPKEPQGEASCQT